jgi:hypothetical protein
MPLNISGMLALLHALVFPRIVLPRLVVNGASRELYLPLHFQVTNKQDIRQLDFAALRRAGYHGAVFDKDNCLVRTTHIQASQSCSFHADASPQRQARSGAAGAHTSPATDLPPLLQQPFRTLGRNVWKLSGPPTSSS